MSILIVSFCYLDLTKLKYKLFSLFKSRVQAVKTLYAYTVLYFSHGLQITKRCLHVSPCFQSTLFWHSQQNGILPDAYYRCKVVLKCSALSFGGEVTSFIVFFCWFWQCIQQSLWHGCTIWEGRESDCEATYGWVQALATPWECSP